jgi:hypothetical protein
MTRRRVVVVVVVAGLAGLFVATIVFGWDHAIYRGIAWTWENGPHKPGQGTGYAFVSGIGSDLGEVTLVTGLVILYRKVNCNIKGCWRIQWRTYVDADGHPHHWCRKHHPDEPLRAGQIASFVAEHDRRRKQAGAPPVASVPES